MKKTVSLSPQLSTSTVQSRSSIWSVRRSFFLNKLWRPRNILFEEVDL